MIERGVAISEGQRLTLVKMTHNVSVKSWDKADILLRLREGEEEDLQVEELETGPAVSSRRDCEIWVPAQIAVKVRSALANLRATGLAELDVEQVRGNLKLSDVQQVALAEVYGSLNATAVTALRLAGSAYGNAGLKGVGTADLQNLRGNINAKDMEGLRVSRVGGNLYVRAISGPLTVEQVGGNARLKSIAGAVSIDQVAGNLAAKDLTGGAKVPKIGGNLVLNGELGQGLTYQFAARGNAVLRLSEEASAHLTLTARGRVVSSAGMADEKREGNTLTGTVGDGGTEVAIEARGNVMVGGSEPVINIELGEEITRQVEEGLRAIDLEALSRRASEEMEAAMSRLQVKLESTDWERIGLQSQKAVERAMEQMRRNMDRMTAKAAHQQERLERRLEREKGRLERAERKHHRAHRSGYADDAETAEWDTGSEEEYDAVDPQANLDEERLSILRMVEQGQITPEEAEMLLEALQHS
jgi:hypothetical protein